MALLNERFYCCNSFFIRLSFRLELELIDNIYFFGHGC